MRLRPQRLRSRLTLWYVGVLTGILSLYLAAVSLLLFWQMSGVLRRLAAEDLETVKGLLYVEPGGNVGVREDFHHNAEWKQVQERLLEILSLDGRILYRNERLGSRTLGGAPFQREGLGGYSGRSGRASDGTPVILISRQYDLQGHPVLIRVGYPQDLIWDQLRQTLLIVGLALPLVLAGTGYLGYRVVGRALDPIGRMTARAERINSERLNERLPEDNPEDELGQLARVFNAMLSRVEQSFEQLRRFTADASHELRTPLAAMRAIGEAGLQKRATTEQYRDLVGSMLEEVNRLAQIVDSLLVLSRADAGQILMHASAFRFSDVVHEAASLLEVLMEDKGLRFHIEGNQEAWVYADRMYLRQAVINVLHNAVKFTPQGGDISARVGPVGKASVELSIADNGPGIPDEYAPKVFQRFYRVEETNGGRTGAGLGLAIAMWVVRANEGEIGVRNSPGGGSTFWIRLPAATAGP